MLHNFWLAKPSGLANQKLCYIHIYKFLERKTKNVLENGWWIPIRWSRRLLFAALLRWLVVLGGGGGGGGG